MGIISKLLNLPAALSIRFWKRANPWLLRSRGVVFGRNVVIPGRVNFSGGGKIAIGDNLYFSSGNGVNPICSNLRGDIHIESGGQLIIGDNVGMSSTRIWVSQKVVIGDHVNIGGCVLITDTDAHPIDWQERRSGAATTLSAPVEIGHDAWIGAHAIILKGVKIGERSVIGAGSVVTHSIPADCVAAGNPCRVIKKLK